MLRFPLQVQRSLTCLSIALGALGGCSSSDSDEGPSGATACVPFATAFPNLPPLGAASSVDEATFLDAYPKRACDVEEQCCQAAGKAFNRANCEQEKSLYFEKLTAQPGAVLDPVIAGGCLAELDQMKAICPVWGVLVALELVEDCVLVYKGQLAPGASCSKGNVCAAPEGVRASCVEQADQTWRCETTSIDGQLGSECDPATSATVRRGCARGLECDRSTKTCVAECSGAQMACEWSLDCGLPYECVGGRCVPGKAVGAACTADGECASHECLGGACALGLDYTCK